MFVVRGAEGEARVIVGRLNRVLLGVWRFVKFTTSRWLTVDTSSRVLVAGMLTGLEDFVQYIMGISHTLAYIKGFTRLRESEDCRRFVVKAAIASRAPESLQV